MTTATSLRRRNGHLRFRPFGSGDGPLVIGLPGILSPASSWTVFARALADRGLRGVVVDQRGRGRTTVTEGGFGIEAMAADAVALVEHFDEPDTVLLGHSMGALVAGRAAATLYRQQWPGMLRTALVDPPFSGPGRAYPTPLADYLDVIAQAQEPGWGPDTAQARYPAWSVDGDWVASVGTCHPEAVRRAYEDFHRDLLGDTWPALSGVVLRGELSDVALLEDLQNLQARHPRITCMTVPGVGHMLPVEAPEALASTLEETL